MFTTNKEQTFRNPNWNSWILRRRSCRQHSRLRLLRFGWPHLLSEARTDRGGDSAAHGAAPPLALLPSRQTWPPASLNGSCPSWKAQPLAPEKRPTKKRRDRLLNWVVFIVLSCTKWHRRTAAIWIGLFVPSSVHNGGRLMSRYINPWRTSPHSEMGAFTLLLVETDWKFLSYIIYTQWFVMCGIIIPQHIHWSTTLLLDELCHTQKQHQRFIYTDRKIFISIIISITIERILCSHRNSFN